MMDHPSHHIHDNKAAAGHLRGFNLNWTKSWQVAVKPDKSWTSKHDTRSNATDAAAAYEKLYNFSSHPSIKSDSCDSGYRSVLQVKRKKSISRTQVNSILNVF